MLQKINAWAKRIKQQVMLLWTAYQHPECPMYVKLLIGLIVLYALSPIDLIPDFIPVLGYLDEMILLPVLIGLALRLIPNHLIVLAQQELANKENFNKEKSPKPKLWLGGLLVVSIWILGITWLGHLLAPMLPKF
ncbi:MAG: YkvA family protein [Polynucleobacter victoriensis]